MSTILQNNLELNKTVQQIMDRSLAKGTLTQYECGFNSYKQFLLLAGFSWNDKYEMPPLSEDSLIHYATHCHKHLNLKCSTIKLYICGIRYKFLQSGIPNLFSNCCSSKMFRLEAIYKGIKKSEVKNTRERLPITYDILLDICSHLQKGIFSVYTDILIETACIIAYFGFLRCGEFTVNIEFDTECNLCLEDIRFVDDSAVLHLKSSKTDPFRLGVDIHLFRNDSALCPVKILHKYLSTRLSKFNKNSSSDPLFLMEDGEALTRLYFISHLKSILQFLGHNSDKYNGHSFRIGAATSVASKIEDHLIKVLGRWNSQCYTRYIHTPLSTIKQAQLALIN